MSAPRCPEAGVPVPTSAGSGSSGAAALDVRPVEPRHRFEIIMGAWERLAAGEAMELTVDHDPRCMYYTLRATRGEDAFTFDYLDEGPETWRVRIRKTGRSHAAHGPG